MDLLDQFNAVWNAHGLDTAMTMWTDDIVVEHRQDHYEVGVGHRSRTPLG